MNFRLVTDLRQTEPTLQNLHCVPYVCMYDEIYTSSYGNWFVFVDDSDEFSGGTDYVLPILPVSPAGICKNKDSKTRDIGVA